MNDSENASVPVDAFPYQRELAALARRHSCGLQVVNDIRVMS